MNKGKYSILDINLIGYKLEINLYLTKDCSTIIRDNALLLLYLWKDQQLKYKYSKELFKL